MSKVGEKGLNVPLVALGAMASSFVGLLYGYAYLKDSIIDAWKLLGDDQAYLMDSADQGQPYGFLGQYLAVFPGLIFDAFGAPITCLYGGTLCLLGFGAVGMSIPSPNSIAQVGKNFSSGLLPLGLLLAGQGSKGLGFGSLLGTVKACGDSYASAISGFFLMLDALSSMVLMVVYDSVYKPTFQSGLDPKEDVQEKADSDGNFFIILACTIFTVAVIAALGFKTLLPSDETNAETTPLVAKASSYRRRNSRTSNTSRNSSIADEADLQAFRKLQKGEEEVDEEPLLPASSSELTKKKFPFFAVACVFAVMATSEACGLAFNGFIGESFVAHRLSRFLMTHTEVDGEKSKWVGLKESLVTKDLLGQGTHAADLMKIRDLVQQAAENVPSFVMKDGEEFVFSHTENPSGTDLVYRVSGATEEARVGTKPLESTAVDLLSKDSGEMSNDLKAAVAKLRPVSAFLVGKKNDKVVVQLTGHETIPLSLKEKSEQTVEGLNNVMKIQNIDRNAVTVLIENPVSREGETENLRVELKKLFAHGTENFMEFASMSKQGLHPVAYPTYAKAVKTDIEALPFFAWNKMWVHKENKMVMCYKLTPDGKECAKEGKSVETAKHFVFDAAKAKANKDTSAKGVKKALTMIFAGSNAAGRLAIGFAADPLAKSFTSAPLSLWFVLGCILNAVVYGFFAMAHPGSTTDSAKESAPFSLYFMTFLAAFGYGGVFTINTSYLKTIVPAEKVGLTLGLSLVILAFANLAVQKFSKNVSDAGNFWEANPQPYYDANHDIGHIGENFRGPFFYLACIFSLVALVPSGALYLSEVAARKAAKRDEFVADLDSTEESE